MELTTKERQVLKNYWGMPLRVKAGNVELKKGECWGILCSIKDAKENTQMLISKSERK